MQAEEPDELAGPNQYLPINVYKGVLRRGGRMARATLVHPPRIRCLGCFFAFRARIRALNVSRWGGGKKWTSNSECRKIGEVDDNYL